MFASVAWSGSVACQQRTGTGCSAFVTTSQLFSLSTRGGAATRLCGPCAAEPPPPSLAASCSGSCVTSRRSAIPRMRARETRWPLGPFDAVTFASWRCSSGTPACAEIFTIEFCQPRQCHLTCPSSRSDLPEFGCEPTPLPSSQFPRLPAIQRQQKPPDQFWHRRQEVRLHAPRQHLPHTVAARLGSRVAALRVRSRRLHMDPSSVPLNVTSELSRCWRGPALAQFAQAPPPLCQRRLGFRHDRVRCTALSCTQGVPGSPPR